MPSPRPSVPQLLSAKKTSHLQLPFISYYCSKSSLLILRSSAGTTIPDFQRRLCTSFCNGLVRKYSSPKFHLGKNGTVPFKILAHVNGIWFLRKGKGNATYRAELAFSCDLQWPMTTGPQWVLSIKSQFIRSYIQEVPRLLQKFSIWRDTQSSTLLEIWQLQNWKASLKKKKSSKMFGLW